MYSRWISALPLVLCLLVPQAAQARDELVIGVAQFPSSLDPYVNADIIKGYVLGFVQRPVTSFDRDWKLSCLLCTVVPTIENGLARPEGNGGLAVTLRLRPGLDWGDGVPVTARDIVFTWKRATDPHGAFADPHIWVNVRPIEVVDDRTVILHLKQAAYAYNQWGPLLPEHIERQDDAAIQADGSDRIRSPYADTPTEAGLYDGPYVVADYRSGDQITLVRNPHWSGPVPAIRRIVIRAIQNTAALQANLLSGDVDMAAETIGLTLDQVLALRQHWPDRFTYVFRPSLGYEHINLNLANPILKDVRVRRALLLAVDRSTISARLFGGLQPVAATWVSPLDQNYTGNTATYGYDPVRARALLAEAGWQPGADGICRNGAGQPLSLSFATTAGDKERELIQQVLQSEWRSAGVQVTIVNVPARTLFGETLRRRQYDLAMFTYIGEVQGSPRSTLASARIPTEANHYIGGNTTGFSDPTMDTDIAAFETGLDPGRQQSVFAEMQRLYADQLPALPLFFRTEAAVLPNWLHGYALTGHSGYSPRWAEFWRAD